MKERKRKQQPARYGDGRVERHGAGWRGVLSVEGHRLRGPVLATEAEAGAWLKQKQDEKGAVRLGLLEVRPKADRRVTFNDLKEDLERWFEIGGDRRRTGQTVTGYKNDLAHVLAVWGKRSVADVSKSAIDNYKADLASAGLATGTIRNRLDRLAQLLALAKEKGIIRELPRVQRPKLVLRSERTATTDDELAELLKAARALKDPRAEAVILLTCDAGLRRGELPLLRGGNIFLDATPELPYGYIHVPVRSETERTKSARARNVPILTVRLQAALRPLLHGHDDPILPGLDSEWGITSLGRRIWAMAGLGKCCRLHQNRHRFATLLSEAGEAPDRVRQWLGHADLATTLRYFHSAALPTEAAFGAMTGRQKPQKSPSGSGKVVAMRVKRSKQKT